VTAIPRQNAVAAAAASRVRQHRAPKQRRQQLLAFAAAARRAVCLEDAPAAALRSQQLKFDHFRREYNAERPHEALELKTPAHMYQPSPRAMPDKLPPLECPDRFELRYVSANGGIRWNYAWVNVSTVCAGAYVGLEEIDDGVWNIYFGALRLGRLLGRKMKIEDAYGRVYRRR